MIKINYNPETGAVLNAYDVATCANIPEPNITVADEVWAAAHDVRRTLTVENGVLIVGDPIVTVGDYERAVDNLLKETAQAKGYDTAYTCLSYTGSTVQKWRNEAIAFGAWRDDVWAACHAILNAVEAGTRTAPTVAGLLAELPQINWPEDVQQDV